jgi:hypothetical protein
MLSGDWEDILANRDEEIEDLEAELEAQKLKIKELESLLEEGLENLRQAKPPNDTTNSIVDDFLVSANLMTHTQYNVMIK